MQVYKSGKRDIKYIIKQKARETQYTCSHIAQQRQRSALRLLCSNK